jgi:hypothetical protein
MPSDLPLFFRELLLRPRQISAVAPSSAVLARAMAAPLRPGFGTVVEVGPGTGSLTRAILQRGIAPSDLTLFEMNPTFAGALRAAFPGVTVHAAPAQAMPDLVAPGVAAVVSGLPLLSMPERLRGAVHLWCGRTAGRGRARGAASDRAARAAGLGQPAPGPGLDLQPARRRYATVCQLISAGFASRPAPDRSGRPHR